MRDEMKEQLPRAQEGEKHNKGSKEGRVDGWMDGQSDGWIDGRSDEWMNGQTDE